MSATRTDLQIVSMINAPDEPSRGRGVAALLEKSKPAIKAWLMRKGRNELDAEEIIQESVAMLLENLNDGKFNGSGSLSGYLFGIARNQSNNFTRKHHREHLLDPTEKPLPNPFYFLYETPESIYEAGEKAERVRMVLEKLRPRCKSVLMLWANGFSFEEIAEQAEFGSAQSAMNKKCKCFRELMAMLEADPDLFE